MRRIAAYCTCLLASMSTVYKLHVISWEGLEEHLKQISTVGHHENVGNEALMASSPDISNHIQADCKLEESWPVLKAAAGYVRAPPRCWVLRCTSNKPPVPRRDETLQLLQISNAQQTRDIVGGRMIISNLSWQIPKWPNLKRVVPNLRSLACGTSDPPPWHNHASHNQWNFNLQKSDFGRYFGKVT